MKVLHLSDAHFRKSPHEGAEDLIHVALLDVVKGLEFDVVVFSGDLAYSAKATEYARASTFLQAVAAGKPIVVVPGNHDVDRAATDRNALFNAHASQDHYARNRPEVLRGNRFAAFLSAASPYLLDWSRDLTTAHNAVSNVTYVGINTALLSYGTDVDLEKLAADEDVLTRTLATDVDSDNLIVAVGHHPLGWLHQWNRDRVRQALSRNTRGAHLYLHGHLHAAQAAATTSSVGQRLTTIQAGSVYQGSQWENSFWLLDIDREGNRVLPSLFAFSGDTGTFVKDNLRSQPIICDLGAIRPRTVVAVADGSLPAPAISLPQETPDRIRKLEELFGIVWEPAGLPPACPLAGVFWPVRLRKPTLIHAAQAFVAASLQRSGVPITLCLDTLGNISSCSAATFKDRMERHFAHVGADWSAVTVHESAVILAPSGSDDRLRQTWDILSQWLSRDNNRLSQVLTVCKLLAQDQRDLTETLGKKPRRLMTPAVVWACFAQISGQPAIPGPRSAAQTAWLTLAGHDERPLWDAWRSVFGDGRHVGHLYVPELANLTARGSGNLTMAETDIGWSSKADILKSLQEDLLPASDKEHLLGWLVLQCLLLPHVVKGTTLTLDGLSIKHPDDIAALDKHKIDNVREAAATLARDILL